MVALLLLLLGAALAGYGFVAYRRGLARHALATASWRQGDATIARSWIEEVVSTSTGSNGPMESTSYRARVAYRYRDGTGDDREGTNPFLCARVNFSSRKRAQAWLDGVPAGATVPVWYDPARPEDSALELNRPSLSLVIVLGAVGLAAIALAMVLLARG